MIHNDLSHLWVVFYYCFTTHAQSGQHNYQQHTLTLTQTALGGQHLAERLTQLATGSGRHVNDHKAIKTQLENIAEDQQTKTHQQSPYTLIESAADTLFQRSMGEMITTLPMHF
ncbi:hypothetical protein I6E61_07470 [Psychrobacter sp. NZS113]|uniref:hypothetical protein n=1 Tax=Psychrobacter sp. NZS113 TaxID=2792045 RepID=UPI0018CE8076|nr:hypothetical protein [Psychrobacter sp. NZS113]MBH0096218.1 hypothetical protein [Psychrobacter sp. NZS113]